MKRLLALASLLLLLLAACSADAPAASTESTAAEATEQTAAPTETTAPEETEDEELLFVHFIDVGQADCTLLKYGDTEILIDGGNAADGMTVTNYLYSLGVEELELVINTHAHEDHVGGLATVARKFAIDEIWASESPSYSSAFNSFSYYAQLQGVSIDYPEVGQTYTVDGLTLTVLGPVAEYDDVNNTSLVILVEFGERRFLFTGDMERDAEQDLLDSGADVHADVLKVGHHGSYTSTSYVFLRAVAPTYGVIHVGAGNDYGHPHESTISRLTDADVAIFRTDLMGSIVIGCDGEELVFFWDNGAEDPANWILDAA